MGEARLWVNIMSVLSRKLRETVLYFIAALNCAISVVVYYSGATDKAIYTILLGIFLLQVVGLSEREKS